mgnify:CR=1 FL=1
MNIFLLLTIAMLMIILMLRRHIPIGLYAHQRYFYLADESTGAAVSGAGITRNLNNAAHL